MIVNCCLCASQDPGNLGRPGKTERNRNKEQVCVCSPCHAMLHPSCSTHHTVRSYKFALVVNCLFISCFFRIFMDKRKRGVEVAHRNRRIPTHPVLSPTLTFPSHRFACYPHHTPSYALACTLSMCYCCYCCLCASQDQEDQKSLDLGRPGKTERNRSRSGRDSSMEVTSEQVCCSPVASVRMLTHIIRPRQFALVVLFPGSSGSGKRE